MQVAGILHVGEAQATVRAIGARTRGSSWLYLAVMLGLEATGAAIGYAVPADDRSFGIFVGLVAGFVTYFLIARRLLQSRFRRQFARWGLPQEFELKFEITPEALIYDVGGVYHRAPWAMVVELFESHHYWIFLVHSAPWFVPQRFFANTADERAFVRAALEHMSEGARSRSPRAVEFADLENAGG